MFTIYIRSLVDAFSLHTVKLLSPPIFGISAVFFKPKNLIVAPSLGQDDKLIEAGKFFADAFWASKPGGTKSLSSKQNKLLTNQQISEFRKRYAQRLGKSQLDRRSELMLCLEKGTGEVVGCAGIELDNINNKKSNRSNVQSTASNISRKPLMSNLAVGKQYRRKGVAEDLVLATEALVRNQWGYEECYLFVEKKNTPAIKLYRKLGYKKVWQDDDAKTITPKDNGSIDTTSTTIICMKKNLSSSIFINMFNRILPF